jgi:hypothetical protein
VDLGALSRLSHPLLPVQPWFYDANRHTVVQRWFIPETDWQRWQAVPLPEEVSAVAARVCWPTVATVYREVPLPALGDDVVPGAGAEDESE